MNGEIAEKMVTEGQAVQPGDNLFLIADRSVLWVDLAVFEMDARSVRIGSVVEIKVDALPGKTTCPRLRTPRPRISPGLAGLLMIPGLYMAAAGGDCGYARTNGQTEQPHRGSRRRDGAASP